MASKQLQTFDFESDRIRISIGENDDTYFVATDLARILGYGSAKDMVRSLDADEKGMHKVPTLGGDQSMLVVNESGLYRLILNRETAYIKDEDARNHVKRFQRWITHDVLPSIRRHGGYMVGQETMSPEEMLAASMRWLKSRIAEQRGQIAQQALQLEAQRPKVLFADAVAASDGTCLVGELAKMLTQAGFKIGQNRLFRLLRDDGYLGTVGQNYNVPKQRYVEAGLFKIKETAVTHADGHVTLNRTPKVTGKGQTYFIDRYAPKEGKNNR